MTVSATDLRGPVGSGGVGPDGVRAVLARHMRLDGYDFVLDLERSRGSWLVDAVTGESYLDLYTFFASSPLGLNPPELVGDREFMRVLGEVAVNKPANGDVYTTHLAEFVETFQRVLGDPELPHLFFVEGGALAVENAVKCAFDWKSRRNEAAGRSPRLGAKVLHLTSAFHGRSGYTLSLTNTEPAKTDRFPQFGWPRIETPALRFPLASHRADNEQRERRALEQAHAAFREHGHDIACFIAEPIQGEGGDNHLSSEFLHAMQAMCGDNDALFVLDEVQTGVGITGSAWAYQQLGLRPDVVAFGKKTQVGGVMAGRRVDEVPDNVFRTPGRISSTWGGGLSDMVRSRRLLEVIERDGLVERAVHVGAVLLAGLRRLSRLHPELVANVRGRGLMCAFDLPTTRLRNRMIENLQRDERVLALACGPRSLRLRPALSIAEDEVALALTAFERVAERLAGAPPAA